MAKKDDALAKELKDSRVSTNLLIAGSGVLTAGAILKNRDPNNTGLDDRFGQALVAAGRGLTEAGQATTGPRLIIGLEAANAAITALIADLKELQESAN